MAKIGNVVALSTLSLLAFIARALLDWKYVFPFFVDMTFETILAGLLVYAFIVFAWVWALANLSRNSNTALAILILGNLIQLLFNGMLTLLVFCPSPCPTIWPVSEIIIWSNTFIGLFGLISILAYWQAERRFHAP